MKPYNLDTAANTLSLNGVPVNPPDSSNDGHALIYDAKGNILKWADSAGNATQIQGFAVPAPTDANDGQALMYNKTTGEFTYGTAGTPPNTNMFWVSMDNEVVLNPMPTNDTVVDSMSITLPSSTDPRIALVWAFVTWYSSHTNRVLIYLDGASQYAQAVHGHATGGGSDGSQYDASIAGYPLAIPGDGATHVIEIRFNAVDSTSEVDLYERSLIVMTIKGSSGTTI